MSREQCLAPQAGGATGRECRLPPQAGACALAGAQARPRGHGRREAGAA